MIGGAAVPYGRLWPTGANEPTIFFTPVAMTGARRGGEVQNPEVGRAKVKRETIESPIETFTIRSEGAGSGSTLVLEWEKTRVKIPVKPAS